MLMDVVNTILVAFSKCLLQDAGVISLDRGSTLLPENCAVSTRSFSTLVLKARTAAASRRLRSRVVAVDDVGNGDDDNDDDDDDEEDKDEDVADDALSNMTSPRLADCE